ncbi:MAG: hypothetical protein QME42_11135 [bacterium]|nr:hypothetical protein [bacterium]
MSKKMSYSFQEGSVSNEKSEILRNKKSGKPITVNLQVPKSVMDRIEELTEWEKQSAKAKWILGVPSNY